MQPTLALHNEILVLGGATMSRQWVDEDMRNRTTASGCVVVLHRPALPERTVRNTGGLTWLPDSA
jgi:hypothetical protein